MSDVSLRCIWRSAPYDLKGLTNVVSDLEACLEWGDVVALQAPMGTGKTTLVSAMARHFNALDAASSPTFALCQSHPIPVEAEGPKRVIRHLDLYRIEHPSELHGLGWEELMDDADALTFVEWPERAADHFPVDALLLRIEQLPDDLRLASLWQRESD